MVWLTADSRATSLEPSGDRNSNSREKEGTSETKATG